MLVHDRRRASVIPTILVVFRIDSALMGYALSIAMPRRTG